MTCISDAAHELLYALYPLRIGLQVLLPVLILLAAYLYKQMKEAN